MKVVTNGALTVELEGWERLVCFRSKVSIDRSSVTALTWHDDYVDPGQALRVLGTALPRVLYGGNFRRHGQREFWFLRGATGFRTTRAANVVEIETTDRTCARLLLTVSRAEAERLIAWFDGSRS